MGGVALIAKVLIAAKFALGLTSKLSCASAAAETIESIEAARPAKTRETVLIRTSFPHRYTHGCCKPSALAYMEAQTNRRRSVRSTLTAGGEWQKVQTMARSLRSQSVNVGSIRLS